MYIFKYMTYYSLSKTSSTLYQQLILTHTFHSLLVTLELVLLSSDTMHHQQNYFNEECYFYFNRIMNLLPIIDLNLPINLIKSKTKCYIW